MLSRYLKNTTPPFPNPATRRPVGATTRSNTSPLRFTWSYTNPPPVSDCDVAGKIQRLSSESTFTAPARIGDVLFETVAQANPRDWHFSTRRHRTIRQQPINVMVVAAYTNSHFTQRVNFSRIEVGANYWRRIGCWFCNRSCVNQCASLERCQVCPIIQSSRGIKIHSATDDKSQVRYLCWRDSFNDVCVFVNQNHRARCTVNKKKTNHRDTK